MSRFSDQPLPTKLPAVDKREREKLIPVARGSEFSPEQTAIEKLTMVSEQNLREKIQLISVTRA